MNFFRYPWGANGDGLEMPPQAKTSDGKVSEEEGFGNRYSLLYDPSNPSLSNPEALPLLRKVFNGILNKITGAIKQYQTIGVPDFITSADNGGSPFSYTKGAVCFLDGIEYRSLVSNNVTTPPSTSWEKVAPSAIDSTNALISSPSIVSNAFFTGVTTGKYLTVKIEGLATATENSVMDFGAITVRIMQDDRDANGVTIPCSWIIFLKGDMKNGIWENMQAIAIGTDSDDELLVSFTRTSTDAFLEFDFTAIGSSYMSVVVQDVSTYIVGSYSPNVTISMQEAKLGTLATDGVLSVKKDAPLASPAFSGTPTINGTPLSPFGNGFKNHIIDGRFDFWYEGTSQTTAGYGSDAMWRNENVGSTKTHSRQSFAVGEVFSDGTLAPRYFSRTEVSSVAGAGNYITKRTKLEDVTRLAGKTVTFSFYAKADSVKNIAIELVQSFGTGGSPSATIYKIGSQKIALTTVWTKYKATIQVPSIAGKVLGTGENTSSTALVFWFDAGSDFNARTDNLGQQSGTFDIAMVQLEEGSAATEFEWNGLSVEESRVGRYYEVCYRFLTSVAANSSTNFEGAYASYCYKSHKRATPTAVLEHIQGSGGVNNVKNVSMDAVFIGPATYSSNANWAETKITLDARF